MGFLEPVAPLSLPCGALLMISARCAKLCCFGSPTPDNHVKCSSCSSREGRRETPRDGVQDGQSPNAGGVVHTGASRTVSCCAARPVPSGLYYYQYIIIIIIIIITRCRTPRRPVPRRPERSGLPAFLHTYYTYTCIERERHMYIYIYIYIDIYIYIYIDR